MAALPAGAAFGAAPVDRVPTSAHGLIFTPLHAGSSYVPGERAGWTVALAPGVKPARGSYSFTITRDEKAVVGTGSFDLSSGSGSAEIDLPGEVGAFRVIVDYMAPPPPPPLTAAQARAVNAALRRLLVATDPSLAGILARYPDYQLVPARRFRFQDLMEHRVATLEARVGRQ